ncbi:unnamed protein product [Lactuca saligna]|uniref:Uncharacterized protein n=1 Tax=Lactuca saligna TaxID=75948 RepID=A0AA35VMS2_LACSI|nr:unnamed protein product [Lactuca saligna]
MPSVCVRVFMSKMIDLVKNPIRKGSRDLFFVRHLIDRQGERKGNEYRTRREERRHNQLGGRGDWNRTELKAVKKKTHEVSKVMASGIRLRPKKRKGKEKTLFVFGKIDVKTTVEMVASTNRTRKSRTRVIWNVDSRKYYVWEDRCNNGGSNRRCNDC